ncbi:MAG: COX15/CtaA family protein [Acidimicrobiales bacterium]
MRPLRLSPTAFGRLALVTTVALALTIVTGAAVRLTGSGLGCPDWPTCAGHQVVAAWSFHPMVEFTNRLIVVAVSILVVATALASLIRSPPRRDLAWLSFALIGGVMAQIVLGGLTVLFKLAPPLVMAHFLLSLAVLADALVLFHRAERPHTPSVAMVSKPMVRLTQLVLITTTAVIILGTAVTGSGPHSGDIHAKRLAIKFSAMAEIHATAVMFLIGLTLAALFAFHQAGMPESTQKRGRVLLYVMVGQGVVGYVQYFTRVPVLLVGIHVAGATSVFVGAVRLYLGLYANPVPQATGVSPSDSASTGVGVDPNCALIGP